jgi:hypothetical protein
MASLPGQADRQHSERETGGEGVRLEEAVAAQLIDRTTSLTISTCGSEIDGRPATRDDPSHFAHGPCRITGAHTGTLFGDAQRSPDACSEELREHDLTTSSETALGTYMIISSSSTEVQSTLGGRQEVEDVDFASASAVVRPCRTPRQFSDLPNEVLLHILSYLDVCDLLATSRVRSIIPPWPPPVSIVQPFPVVDIPRRCGSP